MRKITLLLLFTNLYCYLLGQESTAPKTRFIKPTIEVGISNFTNEQLVDSIKQGNAINWGIGIQMGNLTDLVVVPFLKFNRVNLKLDSTFRENNILEMNNFSFGTIIPLFHSKSTKIQTTVSGIIGSGKTPFHNDAEQYTGMNLGLILENKLFNETKANFQITYTYLRSKQHFIQDYGSINFQVGIII